MSVELSTWQPLCEFSAILIVLGAAGCLSSRDRMSWWQSQGLIVLGVIVGFAAVGAMHPRVDLFSLGVWIPLVLALELVTVAKVMRRVRHFNNQQSLLINRDPNPPISKCE